jgi:hypothetical protein
VTTLAQWIAETRDYLDGDRSAEANRVASYTAGSGTMVLQDGLGNIGAGTLISVGLNDLFVTSANTLTKTITVVGGSRGSTDVSATVNDMVLVSPRFSDHQILRALNRHLASLSSPRVGMFRVGTVELDYVASLEGYDLTGVTGFVKVLDVRRQTYGPSMSWPSVPSVMWDVMESAPTSDFASGMALRVREGHTGLAVQLVYARSFSTIAASLAADVATTGLTAEQEDIPPLGAAYRLMAGREIPRNTVTAQGDARRAEEVPPGAVARSYAGVVGLWNQRVEEEVSRLKARYPVGW